MGDPAERRVELAEFLKARRRALAPRDVGLPSGGRRRTQGLRREEVAVLAGLSPTWYAYMEQGRRINPSAAVLESLCHVLRLGTDERRYVYELATGQAPPESGIGLHRSPVGDQTMIGAVIDCMADWNYPVYIVDAGGTLLAWNRAVDEWFADFSAMPETERNFVKWMLTSTQARERFVHWAEEARHIVAILRARHHSAHLRDDRRRLIGELRSTSAEFNEWWSQHEVQGHHAHERVLRHPKLGVQQLRVIVLHPADDLSVTIAFHTRTNDGEATSGRPIGFSIGT